MEPDKALKLIDKAREFCIESHEGQMRKNGVDSYHVHPFDVVEILRRHGCGDYVAQCMGYLHDVLEDCNVPYSKILDMFGYEIATGVFILSKNKGKDLSGEKLSKELYKKRLELTREKIQKVKIADMIDNTRTLEELSAEGIERKITDAREFYIPLGKMIAPEMADELEGNIDRYEGVYCT